MHRRTFIATAVATLAARRVAWAQAARLPRVALMARADVPEEMVEGRHPYWGALLGGLRDLGHVDGQTISVERWSGSGMTDDAYAVLCQRVVATRPDIFVARGRLSIENTRKATSTIPIVGLGGFPDDLLSRLARPGGNTTGIAAVFGTMLLAKMLQLLHDAVPSASRIAWLGQQNRWRSSLSDTTRAGAEQLGLTLVPALYEEPATEAKIRSAMASVADQDIHAVYVHGSQQHFPLREFIADLMLSARLPAISLQLEHARAGLLMSYAPDYAEHYRRLATYVDKILKGADPGELPIEQPTIIKLVLNLKTATALGITLPFRTLAFATEYIE